MVLFQNFSNFKLRSTLHRWFSWKTKSGFVIRTKKDCKKAKKKLNRAKKNSDAVVPPPRGGRPPRRTGEAWPEKKAALADLLSLEVLERGRRRNYERFEPKMAFIGVGEPVRFTWTGPVHLGFSSCSTTVRSSWINPTLLTRLDDPGSILPWAWTFVTTFSLFSCCLLHYFSLNTPLHA